eukprot:352965-Chlamydomonas_euryale.AAC.21
MRQRARKTRTSGASSFVRRGGRLQASLAGLRRMCTFFPTLAGCAEFASPVGGRECGTSSGTSSGTGCTCILTRSCAARAAVPHAALSSLPRARARVSSYETMWRRSPSIATWQLRDSTAAARVRACSAVQPPGQPCLADWHGAGVQRGTEGRLPTVRRTAIIAQAWGANAKRAATNSAHGACGLGAGGWAPMVGRPDRSTAPLRAVAADALAALDNGDARVPPAGGRAPGQKRTVAMHVGYVGTEFKGVWRRQGMHVDRACMWTTDACGQGMHVDNGCMWTGHACGRRMHVDRACMWTTDACGQGMHEDDGCMWTRHACG